MQSEIYRNVSNVNSLYHLELRVVCDQDDASTGCTVLPLGSTQTIECRLDRAWLSDVQLLASFSEFSLGLLRNTRMVPTEWVLRESSEDLISLAFTFVAHAEPDESKIRREVFRCDIMHPLGNSSQHLMLTYGRMRPHSTPTSHQ